MATTDSAGSPQTGSREERPGTKRLTEDKLAAFQSLETEFIDCFQFLQSIQGQERLTECSVTKTVRLLHALWICECKDSLLSVPFSRGRYEGRLCLELLRAWQEGDTASVVGFLQRKLDHSPYAALTARIAEANAKGDHVLAERLTHGRGVMLNRGFHLVLALDAIFALSDHQLSKEVNSACLQLGHTPHRISEQLAEMESPLYSYAPNPRLARRNMLVMNELGISVTSASADLPGHRTSRVELPKLPQPPYAEHTVWGEIAVVFRAGNYPSGSRRELIAADTPAAGMPGPDQDMEYTSGEV
jgi:hypothetical protein